MSGMPWVHEGFETWSEVIPSTYWLRENPAENYGVSNCRIVFYLRGPKGSIQFMIGTDWGIKSVRAHLSRFGGEHDRHPTGWDLGYHAHEAQYEGQSEQSHECPVLDGPCFYDGSGLQADAMIEGFMAGGTEWLWPKLAEVYRARFEGAEWPSFDPEYKPHPRDK